MASGGIRLRFPKNGTAGGAGKRIAPLPGSDPFVRRPQPKASPGTVGRLPTLPGADPFVRRRPPPRTPRVVQPTPVGPIPRRRRRPVLLPGGGLRGITTPGGPTRGILPGTRQNPSGIGRYSHGPSQSGHGPSLTSTSSFGGGRGGGITSGPKITPGKTAGSRTALTRDDLFAAEVKAPIDSGAYAPAPMERSRQDLIHIRSCDRASGTSSNFRVALDKPIVALDTTDHLLVSVHDAQIPFSFYVVNSRNNGFEVDSADAAAAVVRLTHGNYNANALAVEIKTRIEAADAGTNTYTVTYDSVTNRFTILASANEFVLDFRPAAVTAGGSGTTESLLGATATKIMGFSVGGLGSSGVHDSANASTAALTVISDISVNVAGEEAIYVRSSIPNVNTYETRTRSYSNILAKVPVPVGFFSIIHFTPHARSFTLQMPPRSKLDIIELQLTDSAAIELDLNGLEWEITLMVEHMQKARNHAVDLPAHPRLKRRRLLHR